MPYFYKIDKERRLVINTAAGILTKADVLRLQDQLLADPDFDPSFSQLTDLTNITDLNITAAEMPELTQRTIFSLSSRRAVVASNDVSYGMARMFEILRESKGDTGIRVFRKLEDALDWIVGKSGSS